jgi:glutathione S-transferase
LLVPEIILHHYPESPFSEKVRLMLGYRNQAWRSVTIPIIMPKPDLTALTGGYRRTPVMQIGNDIYCDTALIADVLERMSPAQSLLPKGTEGRARAIGQWADSTLFMTAVAYFYQSAGMGRMLESMTPVQIRAFQQDRAALLGNRALPDLAVASAGMSLYLQALQEMVQDARPFLLGEVVTLADLCCYHPLWFIQAAAPSAGVVRASPLLAAWMDRVKRIGHGLAAGMSSMEAIAVARSSTPVAIESQASGIPGISLGDEVEVMPGDYGLDPVRGELVLVEANHVAVRRHDERAGTVVVHFPRIGYLIRRAGQGAG